MKGISDKSIWRLRGEELTKVRDRVTVEEPLEMVLWYYSRGNRIPYTLSITMRTPGDDKFLSLGFLLTEGVISNTEDVSDVKPEYGIHEAFPEKVHVYLNSTAGFDPDAMTRHFYTNSSCGVCGKASIDQVRQQVPFILKPTLPRVTAETLESLPSALDSEQLLFNKTGSIHAAALFSENGKLIRVFEDVGRHNAMDKLIGFAMSELKLPLRDSLVLVSGRASFELVQKALMAGLPIMAAIGAPSSLAVELAQSHQMSLIGFLSDKGFNIYTGLRRIEGINFPDQ